jgi:hypothetical protein
MAKKTNKITTGVKIKLTEEQGKIINAYIATSRLITLLASHLGSEVMRLEVETWELIHQWYPAVADYNCSLDFTKNVIEVGSKDGDSRDSVRTSTQSMMEKFKPFTPVGPLPKLGDMRDMIEMMRSRAEEMMEEEDDVPF